MTHSTNVFSTDQVAEFFGVKPETVRTWKNTRYSKQLKEGVHHLKNGESDQSPTLWTELGIRTLESLTGKQAKGFISTVSPSVAFDENAVDEVIRPYAIKGVLHLCDRSLLNQMGRIVTSPSDDELRAIDAHINQRLAQLFDAGLASILLEGFQVVSSHADAALREARS